jgi:hypothetical protein
MAAAAEAAGMEVVAAADTWAAAEAAHTSAVVRPTSAAAART